MTVARWLLAILIAVAIVLFFALDLGRHFTLDALKQSQATIAEFRSEHALLTAALFFVAYLLVAVLALPAAAILTLAAGAVFGLWQGVVLVSFASTIGATLAFLLARFLLHDMVQARFSQRLKAVNEGVRRDGWLYLFTVRLIPLFPFFVVNFTAGLTPLRTWTFYWVSQTAMLPSTIIFVNAGTQLAQIRAVEDVLSPGLLGALALLAALPLLSRRIAQLVRARRAYARFRKPRHFDRNLIVIGGGSAGLVTAYIAAALKAQVTLIEAQEMGGDCLNTGCVPSKALLRSARVAHLLRQAETFGLREVPVEPQFAAIMRRVQTVIKTVAPHDSVERYRALGVDCRLGRARLLDPWTVAINGERLTARNIVIATGAEPFVPPIPGLHEAGFLTSESVWSLTELPQRLVVLGGGPIGCELSQAFARLGARVTQVEMAPRLLPREDPECSALLEQRLRAEGVEVRTATKAKAVEISNGQRQLICETEGREEAVPFDQILVAVGRAARVHGQGLEDVGVRFDKTIEVNDYLQTSVPNIYACGDVAGPYQFTHTASHMAWYCAVNALFGRFKAFKVDYSVIPWATFTDPEIARVGLNETEARARNIPYEVSVFPLAELDRAIAEGATAGFIKVLTVPGKDRILGATITGEQAGEVIAEYVLAMRQRIGLNKLLGTIHIYPTLAEMNKYVAGVWKKAHAPQRVLHALARYHAWMR